MSVDTDSTQRERTADGFLDLIRASRRGKFKLYIGMAAGVGKSYRMLQEAHTLLRNAVDVRIAFIETHSREETQALVAGLPIIPRRSAFYKGKRIEEMDLQAVLNLHPELVIVDELAHSNMPGSRNGKRWEDVLDILDAGINVISAVNIQHIESLNAVVKQITGVAVSERIPDRMLKLADEVVNIDLSADDLIARLQEGRIYTPDKIGIALRNFFRADSILQLRELALKAVAGQIERKVETEVPRGLSYRHERILTCIGSNGEAALNLIRKSARLAGYYNSQWTVLHIETPKRIAQERRQRLIDNFKLATELGATVEQVQGASVAKSIAAYVEANAITTVCIGKPGINIWNIILATSVFNSLLKRLATNDTDLIILS